MKYAKHQKLESNAKGVSQPNAYAMKESITRKQMSIASDVVCSCEQETKSVAAVTLYAAFHPNKLNCCQE